MKKTIATLIIVVGLFAGSVSFAGLGPRTGGPRTESPAPCSVLITDSETMQPATLNCELM